MPWAIVGEPQAGHGGLLTNLKNDRLNHLDPKSQIPANIGHKWKLTLAVLE